MQVAVIGTGNMGSGLASILAQAKHEVTIGSRDMAKAATLASQVGHGAVGGDIEAAVKMADVVILAIPFPFAEETLKAAGDLSKKIIIDISNPITPDFQSLLIGHTTSAAEEIQKLAPQAKVVKAFNTIFAQLLPTEAREGKTLQVFVAADDAGAKAEVSALVKSLGFDAVDAGPLSNSRFIEPIGEMNIHFGYFLGWGPVSAPMWPRA
ncbi:NADP oxidoreductase coenzyme F420-dependent [Tolumonas auensis DSM 9187]|uniref:NADP oxidoreductase coenzyme F420-dependent n=1 Tax=Tolumonas auensis (strain DSM 9187 / NBRC 110442 / TA 4) TaxID=595494 RepID=C4LF84_TOLAT|nr:NADPH-dependent F420 reductase [Tolumonas auensis]ACQ93251.1 NADP oxidoreductase coenzyme F420-dependent [Tolumonas auensis DSM 9187]